MSYRRVQIWPSQSNTKAHIIQTEAGLEACCNKCAHPITGTGVSEADGQMYWQCTHCNILFNHNTKMSEITRTALIPDPNDFLTKSGFTHKTWVETWTGLTVEVTIDE